MGHKKKKTNINILLQKVKYYFMTFSHHLAGKWLNKMPIRMRFYDCFNVYNI